MNKNFVPRQIGAMLCCFIEIILLQLLGMFQIFFHPEVGCLGNLKCLGGIILPVEAPRSVNVKHRQSWIIQVSEEKGGVFSAGMHVAVVSHLHGHKIHFPIGCVIIGEDSAHVLYYGFSPPTQIWHEIKCG